MGQTPWGPRGRPYEVISAFGELLGVHLILNHGELPSDEEADLMVRGLVDAFFTREDAP